MSCRTEAAAVLLGSHEPGVLARQLFLGHLHLCLPRRHRLRPALQRSLSSRRRYFISANKPCCLGQLEPETDRGQSDAVHLHLRSCRHSRHVRPHLPVPVEILCPLISNRDSRLDTRLRKGSGVVVFSLSFFLVTFIVGLIVHLFNAQVPRCVHLAKYTARLKNLDFDAVSTITCQELGIDED